MAAEINEEDLRSLAVVQRIIPFQERLHQTIGSSHGNARLELFDVLVVLLAAFFNPIVRSLRLVEQLSQMDWIKRRTSIERIPKSTLSDALARFDPEQLRPLIEQLVKQIPGLGRRDSDLQQVTRKVLAADGSMFQLAGEVAWTLLSHRPDGRPLSQVRLNLQLDLSSFTPDDADISGGDDGSEAAAFSRRVKPGVIYVVDRNFVHFGFINTVQSAGSNLVLRLRRDTGFAVEQMRALTARDAQAGVVSDAVGHLTGPASAGNRSRASRTGPTPTATFRRVTVIDAADPTRTLTILTDLLEVPAWIVAELYRRRWLIELFFRWLKVWAGFQHSISFSKRGITTQFYIAIIATLLIHLRTGRRVNKYQLFLLGQVACGLASFETIEPILQRIEREKELARARLQRKRMTEKTA